MMPSALGIVRVLSCFAVVVAPALARADVFLPIKVGDAPIETEEPAFRTPSGHWLTRLTPSQVDTVVKRSRISGNGGGGDVGGLLVDQYRHLDSACDFPPQCGGPCNVLLVQWTETTLNPGGVALVFDDVELGVVPGLPAEELPGDQGYLVWPFAAGDTVARIEDLTGGVVVETTFTVLDAQPFGDAKNLTCAEGGPGAQGTCEIVISWENTGVPPNVYSVFINAVFQTNVPATRNQLVLAGAPPGSYTVELIGLQQVETGKFHEGCPVSTSCDLTCTGSLCPPVTNLVLRQIDYGPGPGDNAIDAEWQNGENPYGTGVNVTLDGGAADALPGDTQTVRVDSLGPGDHTIGVQGDCGDPKGLATPVEITIKLFDASPHTTPVSPEGVLCTFTPDPDADGPEVSKTVATWTPLTPSDFVDVFVVDGASLAFVVREVGTATSITINGTAEADQFVLRFYATIDGGSYASPDIACGSTPPTNTYVQGLCTGLGDKPAISTAVFGLNFLFQGGASPPCAKACDGNGDGQFNLSDMVFVLGYLFLGGPAPPLWDDLDQDGQRDPTCKKALPGDDCAESHETCVSPGG